jgi:hypothetical protein
MPVEGQDEVFGADAGMLIPGVPTRAVRACLRMAVRAERALAYASGVDYGDWVMVGARRPERRRRTVRDAGRGHPEEARGHR